MKPGITLAAGKLTLGMLRRIARGGISVALAPGTQSAIDASRAAVQMYGAPTFASANQIFSSYLAEPRTYGITGRFRF